MLSFFTVSIVRAKRSRDPRLSENIRGHPATPTPYAAITILGTIATASVGVPQIIALKYLQSLASFSY